MPLQTKTLARYFDKPLDFIRSYLDLRSREEAAESPICLSSFQEAEQRSSAGGVVHIPLISERIIISAAFEQLSALDKMRAAFFMALSPLSSRARNKLRDILVHAVNNGGLLLLNKVLLERCGPQIVKALSVILDETALPVLIFCTAGKDRTGLLIMLILSILGASDDIIVADYAKSASAYRDLSNKSAMVVSLSQQGLDPNRFLSADPEVMISTLHYLRAHFGSVEAYLVRHGFGYDAQQKLR